jgi:hypothetical protein
VLAGSCCCFGRASMAAKLGIGYEAAGPFPFTCDGWDACGKGGCRFAATTGFVWDAAACCGEVSARSRDRARHPVAGEPRLPSRPASRTLRSASCLARGTCCRGRSAGCAASIVFDCATVLRAQVHRASNGSRRARRARSVIGYIVRRRTPERQALPGRPAPDENSGFQRHAAQSTHERRSTAVTAVGPAGPTMRSGQARGSMARCA